MFEEATVADLVEGDWFTPVLDWGYGCDDVFEVRVAFPLAAEDHRMIHVYYGRADGGRVSSPNEAVSWTGFREARVYRLDRREYSDEELVPVLAALEELSRAVQ